MAVEAVFAELSGRRAQSQPRNTRAEYLGTRLDSFSNMGVGVTENTDCGLVQHQHNICTNTQQRGFLPLLGPLAVGHGE